ncbi:hypothetical protein BC830DRAFT_1167914 [Chytriomyces sp. MP71]|nr:hypothetical protein BC830DRAFT_1167914 [Chytriomyces sp. MP71]
MTQVVQHSEAFAEGICVHLQLVKMGASVLAWVGATSSGADPEPLTPTGRLDSLAFAATTRFDNGAAIGSSLLGKGVDDCSEMMAKRIAAKTKMNVFVSCNLPTESPDLVVFAEQKLMQMVKQVVE